MNLKIYIWEKFQKAVFRYFLQKSKKIPEKNQVSKDDLAELQNTNEPTVPEPAENAGENEESNISLDEIKEEQAQADEAVDEELQIVKK